MPTDASLRKLMRRLQEQFTRYFDARESWKRGVNGDQLSEDDVLVNDIVLVTAQIARYVAKEDCTGAPKGVREWGGLPWRVTLELLKMDLIARGAPEVEEEVVGVEDEEEI